MRMQHSLSRAGLGAAVVHYAQPHHGHNWISERQDCGAYCSQLHTLADHSQALTWRQYHGVGRLGFSDTTTMLAKGLGSRVNDPKPTNQNKRHRKL
jgi:hypothetical protein